MCKLLATFQEGINVRNIYEVAGLQCPACNNTSFGYEDLSVHCASCGASYAIDDGVIVMRKNDALGDEPSIRFYDTFDGTHFVGVSFESNPLIYITTRAYQHFLEELPLDVSGNLLDFCCGDGRLSLWAAERSFSAVVALDSNLASLKRLTLEARRRGLKNLVTICADGVNPPLQKGFFDAVVCVEALYYLASNMNPCSVLAIPESLLASDGVMMVGEFSRFGRAIMDLDAIDLENASSLVKSGFRCEKLNDDRLPTFLWSLSQIRQDFERTGLEIFRESGISIAAALFSYARNFTSYPLRPKLDAAITELVEKISDCTAGSSEAARNNLFALRKRVTR